MKDRLLAFVTDVKLAHIDHVVQLLSKPAAKFRVDPAYEHGGIARLLIQSDTYLSNRDEIRTAVETVDGAEESERATALQELDALETRMLQEQVADCGTATALWERAAAFARKHHRSEPNREEVKDLLANLDSELRAAIGISPSSKYALRIKPDTWQQDVECMFNLAHRVYTAWNGKKD